MSIHHVMKVEVDGLPFTMTMTEFADGFHAMEWVWIHPDLRGKGKFTECMTAISPQFDEHLGEDGHAASFWSFIELGPNKRQRAHAMMAGLNRPMVFDRFYRAYGCYWPAKSDTAIYEYIPQDIKQRVMNHFNG